jgi:branched-chain amino acid aminotransferase
VAASDIQLSPFQTGLLTGWGLFSTLRIYDGVPFALEAHWQRLRRDGHRLHVELDELWDEAQAGFAAVVAANAIGDAPLNAVARIYLIRNHGGLLDVPGRRATDLLIITRDLRSWGASAALRVQPHGRDSQAPLAGTKTLTWAHNLVLVEEANAQGFDDLILLNERGEVAECTAANIFIAGRDGLATPPISSGALPGVSRQVLLESGPRHGLKIEERALTEQDLYRADEVFITSSTREVQPVARINDTKIALGAIARRVEEIFQKEIAAYVGPRRVAKAMA